MDREAYNNCMKPYMQGSGEDKKLDFCVGAKICSGKAASEDEARQICLTEPKKAPKSGKNKKSANCPADMEVLAACVVGKLTDDILSSDKDLTSIMTKILQECQCGKSSKKKKKKSKSVEDFSDEELEALETIQEIGQALGTL